ncbi:Hypothetical predicted protein [Lecanosticta acicola]|uniref:Uncharacterized protein n=1 Tax=Lecanosticta acicola TaxID=111012 RepID=A0AAI8YTJ3_9PEZI|nr:Hypothetical predicted protein [Lecanosticta acicola]
MPEIRAQALDNARVLWPILVVGQNLAARYLTQNVSVPPMTIITVGEGTAISAQVVYAEGQFPNKVGNWLFLRGPDSPSAAEAMQKLLAMTQSMLQDVYTKSVFVQGGLQVKHHPGGGAYYARQD